MKHATLFTLLFSVVFLVSCDKVDDNYQVPANPQATIIKVAGTSGNAALAAGVKDISDGGNKDVVVYDDFFYSEPQSNN